MTTIVFLHAHPDDEASQTSGSMAIATARGDRVVVVFATNGELGTPAADLPEGRTVADHRREEALASARVLGTARVEWLGYADSGMAGWDENDHDGTFNRADVEEAARTVAAILDEEDADVLVGYDWHGGYGHPDHVQVHRVAHRAAALARRRPRLLEGTMNRTEMSRRRAEWLRLREQLAADPAAELPEVPDFDPDAPMGDGNPIGLPEEEIHWRVDVTPVLDRKRAAMQAHSSQTTDIGWMLAMPAEAFVASFGTEYYREPGRDQPIQDGWPFD